jgi:hypothetical protein
MSSSAGSGGLFVMAESLLALELVDLLLSSSPPLGKVPNVATDGKLSGVLRAGGMPSPLSIWGVVGACLTPSTINAVVVVVGSSA